MEEKLNISKSINLSSEMTNPVFFMLQLMGQSVQRESLLLLLHLPSPESSEMSCFFGFFFGFLIKDKVIQTLALNLSEDRAHPLPPRDCDSFLVKTLWGWWGSKGK